MSSSVEDQVDQESQDARECVKFWKDFIFRDVDEPDRDDIFRHVDLEMLTEMITPVEIIMNIISELIISQQKVSKNDLVSEEEEKETTERALQDIMEFSVHMSIILGSLWEHRSNTDERFKRILIHWLSRQTQIAIHSLEIMKDFLRIADIHYNCAISANGPSINISLVLR